MNIKKLNEQLERLLEQDYTTDRALKIYNMTKEQAELAQKAYENRDTEAGYKAFYELWKLTNDQKLSEDIFYDLSADFEWNDKLPQAILRLAKQEGRQDIVREIEEGSFL